MNDRSKATIHYVERSVGRMFEDHGKLFIRDVRFPSLWKTVGNPNTRLHISTSCQPPPYRQRDPVFLHNQAVDYCGNSTITAP